MSDFELSDGTKGTIDKSKLTIFEWRHFWSPNCTDEEGDAILSKVTGLPVQQVSHILYDDYRWLCKAFREKCQEPLNDEKK